jgi:hypothetical protein
LIIVKIFPKAPPILNVIGAIVSATGSLLRHFTAPTLVAAVFYAMKNKLGANDEAKPDV